jgi:hypothetical protein
MNLALTAFTETTALGPPVGPVIDVLIYHAALLAGMGAAARKITGELNSALQPSQGDERTCIDAGSRLIFSLLAPGPRSLRVLVRRGLVQGGSLPWLRAHYLPRQDPEHWHTLTYMGEPPSAWENARRAAERACALDHLRRTHAILGPYSRIYSVSQTAGTAPPQAWVGWQLDRALPVDKALDLLGIGHAWPLAASFWESLLGSPPHPRFGPWSISLGMGGAPRLRVGSTNWSRRIEDDEKRRRMAALVERKGGDRRFAESLYKLIQGAARPGRVHAVGRAVELEFFEGRPVQAEFFIRVP